MSKAAWSVWKNNGPVCEEMFQRKEDVKSYVRSCRAQEERVRLQERDRLFCGPDQRRFSIPHKATHNATHLGLSHLGFDMGSSAPTLMTSALCALSLKLPPEWVPALTLFVRLI